eukprot:1141791-Pelagomonas_calceolata.AAC.2
MHFNGTAFITWSGLGGSKLYFFSVDPHNNWDYDPGVSAPETTAFRGSVHPGGSLHPAHKVQQLPHLLEPPPG